MKKTAFLLMVTLNLIYGADNTVCEKVILATYLHDKYAEAAIADVNKTVSNDTTVHALMQKHQIGIRVRPSGHSFILVLEPITNHQVTMRLLGLMRKWYPDAFANTNPPEFCADNIESTAQTSAQPPVSSNLQAPTDSVLASPQDNAQETNQSEKNENTQTVFVQKQTQTTYPAQETQETQETQKTQKTQEAQEIQETQKTQTSRSTPAIPTPLSDTHPSQAQHPHPLSQWLKWITALTTLGFLGLLLYLFAGRKRMNLYAKEAKEYKKRARRQQIFLAQVLHELRAPVNAIISLSEHLKEHRLTLDEATYVDQIGQAGQMQLALIDDLNDFTKLSVGHFTVTPVEFNINEVLSRVRGVVALQASAKRIDLAFDVDPDVPHAFFGDPLRIEQIFINLLHNAIKFTEHGGVELKISSSHRNAKGDIILKAVVKDTGIGIKEQQLKTLFEPCDKDEKSIRQIIGGTGLGLTIVKQLIDTLEGTIKVESEEGKGTTFKISLPLHTTDSDKRRRYRLPSRDYLGKKAVILDTHGRSAAALRKMLQYFRYEVVVEHSLEKAVEHVTTKEIDLLFIDENYLGKQTITILDMILHNWPVSIVVVESFGNKKRNRALVPNIKHFLVRPFTQKEILDLIIRVFGDKRA